MPDLHSIESALARTGWNRARVKFVARFVVALLTAQTVCLSRLCVLFPSGAAAASNYKRMQRFLRHFDLDFASLASLLIQIAGVPTPWTLALDRTNWKLGKANLNILMLCVVHQGVAFPLFWTVLEKEVQDKEGKEGKAGNSSTTERIALLERFREKFGTGNSAGATDEKGQVTFLCADREFVSGEWLRWLLQNRLSFRLRLKGNILISNGQGEPVHASLLFRDCPILEERSLGFRTLLGQRVFVVGTRLQDGDFLIVISDTAFALTDYALRWGIETLFAAFKSRGFRLEDTHVTCPVRLSRLVGLLSIAYCWAFAAGQWLTQSRPLTLKKHGRMPISSVRRGLDYLRPVALQLCARPNKEHLLKAIQFLSCT